MLFKNLFTLDEVANYIFIVLFCQFTYLLYSQLHEEIRRNVTKKLVRIGKLLTDCGLKDGSRGSREWNSVLRDAKAQQRID